MKFVAFVFLAILENMKMITAEAAGVVKAAKSPDLEPIATDWTNTLLARLDALECKCLSSDCLCEKADYIRARTAPPLPRSTFIGLARRTGLAYSIAEAYYRYYLVDIRLEQSRERMSDLSEEISECTQRVLSRLSEDEVRPFRERLNAASRESNVLAKYIFAPLNS